MRNIVVSSLLASVGVAIGVGCALPLTVYASADSGVRVRDCTSSLARDYQTRVVLTSQTLVLRDGEVSYDDTFESWIGDLPCEVWSWDAKDYLPKNVQFYGTGDEYVEDYEIVDDGVVGDIYDVVVHTKGTVNKADDEIEIVDYVGYVSF